MGSTMGPMLPSGVAVGVLSRTKELPPRALSVGLVSVDVKAKLWLHFCLTF